MSKKNFLILLIISLIFLFSGFNQNAQAGLEHNVSGWAWSENIGWISFNSLNCDSDGNGITDTGNYSQCPVGQPISNYGVNVDSLTGIFSGYAWSEHIGWISFNQADLTGCPISPCEARLNFQDNKVSGWAKVLIDGGGWDGWRRLRGIWTNPLTGESGPYGVWSDTTVSPRELREWAWSDMVIGWSSFNCKDGGYNEATGEHYSICGTSNYKVIISGLNSPPSASDLQQSVQYCNVYAGQGKANLSWTYTDPENTAQQAYSLEVQQFIGGSWQTKVLCENVSTAGLPSGGIGTSAVLIKETPTSELCDLPTTIGDIEYGKSTRWGVNVQDGDGKWSGWTGWAPDDNGFSIDPHAYPWIDFSWTPERPTVDEITQFADQSEVYGGATKSTWSWTFQDGNPSSSNLQNATTTFTSFGPKEVTLKVTDSDGFYCQDPKKTVNARFPLPEWREIIPRP